MPTATQFASPQPRCDRVPPAHREDCCQASDVMDDLPLDPRSWSRVHVSCWVSRRGAPPERFPMNGKALCLMTEDMFAARTPGNASSLHREFRRRLARALALQELLEKLQKASE